jgi:hypothetical protein
MAFPANLPARIDHPSMRSVPVRGGRSIILHHRTTMSQEQVFTGASQNGNLQEALDGAVRQAQEANAGSPLLVQWELAGIMGLLQSGPVNTNVVTVTISVPGSPDSPREPAEGNGGQGATQGNDGGAG